MSDITEIDSEIKRLSEEFDIRSNEYREVCIDAERKRDVYDLAKARAMLSAPPEYKVDEKKAYVVQSCQLQSNECHVAEATRDWYKERLKALSGLLIAVQSRANIIKADLSLTNTRYQ